MTIIIDLTAEQEAQLRAEAEKQNLAPSEYAKTAVEEKLAAQAATEPPRKKRSIMELHGLRAELWEGIDAQEYVTGLRKEWDHRP